MTASGEAKPGWSVEQRSAWMVGKFAATSVHLVARTFRCVSVLDRPTDVDADRPLIIASNHPSWWDPMVGLVSLQRYMPDRPAFVPIDPVGYEAHGVFAKVGFFPVEPNTRRGGVALLNYGQQALGVPGGLVWITPEGRFVDPRVRPVVLKPGASLLASRVAGCQVLPAAIEYRFGGEPKPEAILSFGEVIETDGLSAGAIGEALTAGLTATMDRLAEVVQTGQVDEGGDGPTKILEGSPKLVSSLMKLMRAYRSGPRAYDPRHLDRSD
ncbi:lysophospholipid acyltransferase family protein [Mucisphaera sp.]|uniref:lysophospholipid acyltransferase family protein n=1 Tax=Mucisphaera sp. TaxID=2913024 RepID=UPI003D10B7BC